jgi:serine/threonine-protein kinase
LNKGEDVEPLLAKALEAAEAAQALAPSRLESRMELMQDAWQWALSLQLRGLDPGERLREAIALSEGFAERDKTYRVHNLVGLIFKAWADHEDQKGLDSLAHRGAEIQAYERAIRLDERLPDAWINLGIAYFTRATNARAAAPEGDLERATRALDKAQALNPQHVVPYFYAGLVHERQGRRRASRGEDPRPELALALEQYRKGLAINPTLPVLLNGVGNVLSAQAQEEWNRGGDPFPLLEQARASLEQAVAVAPKQGIGYNNLGEVQAWRARYLRARGQDPGPSVRAAVGFYQPSVATGVFAPTGYISPVSSTRSNITCTSGEASPTSSRKRVPPWAARKRPSRSRVAPV